MRRGWFAALLILATPALGQEVVEVPSGQPVSLLDVIWNEPGPAGLTARFRFLAPEIAAGTGSIDFDTAITDMDHLCNSYALPRTRSGTGPAPAQIVVSLSDRPVDFGVTDTEATQFFEAYAVEGDTCQWEAF